MSTWNLCRHKLPDQEKSVISRAYRGSQTERNSQRSRAMQECFRSWIRIFPTARHSPVPTHSGAVKSQPTSLRAFPNVSQKTGSSNPSAHARSPAIQDTISEQDLECFLASRAQTCRSLRHLLSVSPVAGRTSSYLT